MGLIPITLEDQIGCVQRELSMRRKVYPRWVVLGKMTDHDADFQIACMEEVLKTLQSVRATRTTGNDSHGR